MPLEVVICFIGESVQSTTSTVRASVGCELLLVVGVLNVVVGVLNGTHEKYSLFAVASPQIVMSYLPTVKRDI